MTTNKAQNSITISRLRTGESLSISLDPSKPLHQFVDGTSGAVSPDWERLYPEEQTYITPNIKASSGAPVTILDFVWSHDGTPLTFSSTPTSGWYNSSCGRFALDKQTKALRLVKNLGSLDNTFNDPLTFKANVQVNGVRHVIEKSIDVIITQQAASGYYGIIHPSTSIVDKSTSATITAILKTGATSINDFTVVWKINGVAASGNGKTLVIDHTMVDGIALVTADFKVNSQTVTGAAVQIKDAQDPYYISLFIASQNTQVSENNPVSVKARLIDSEGTEFTGTVAWSWDVMRADENGELNKVTTLTGNPVSITTNLTDDNKSQRDVILLATATINV